MSSTNQVRAFSRFFRVRFRVVSRRVFLLIVFGTLFSLSIHKANAAQLFLFPDPVEVPGKEAALVEVRLDTEGESVNAAQVVLTFPSSVVVREVLTGGSVLPLAPEPVFIGTDVVKISGGAPNGFQGSGTLARLLIEGTPSAAADIATIAFGEETKVYLNDGKATPARLTARSADVHFAPASDIALTSSHADQTTWYTKRTVSFHWDVEEGKQYSYLLSRDPNAIPDDVPDTPVGDIKFEGLEDGVYYFSLCELVQNNAELRCGGANAEPRRIARYRVMVDGTPPEPFDVVVTKHAAVYGGDYWYAVFAPSDAMSGIARIEVAETRTDDEEPSWYEAASPYVLRWQDRSARVRVRATDFAGNVYEVSVAPQPGFPQWAFLLIAFAAIVGIILFQQKRRSGRKYDRMDKGGPPALAGNG